MKNIKRSDNQPRNTMTMTTRNHQTLFDNIYRKEKWGKGKGSGIGSQPNIAAKYLDYIKSIPAGLKVLDLGCGDHQLYEGFDLTRWNYTGADISQLALDLAKQRTPSAELVLISSPSEWLPLAQGMDIVLIKDVICTGQTRSLSSTSCPSVRATAVASS